MPKAAHMLAILWLLKSRKRMTARELAEELEIHVRTVYRCIDALCASGVPIRSESGHHGGYSLLESFAEAPLFFDPDEQKALMHAAIFAREAGYPFGEALNRAIDKLKRYANEEQLAHINRHVAGFDVIIPPSDSSPEALLKELERSVADGRTLFIEYQKGDGTVRSRHIDPYGLVYWKGRWYVVAHCHFRREIRCFRADRIRAFSLTDSVFQRPPEFSARQFFLQRMLPDTVNSEQPVVIHIRGKEEAVQDLCRQWLFGHVLVKRSGNEAWFGVDERAIRTYVPYFLLTYGTSIRVLEPSLLQERLVEVASELLDHYRCVPFTDRECQ
ncbi:helix-turn-helix transcriptional regulator [Kyrpidia tusciae]|uniref:Helix-turn-helix type 11 domain protein n=1 Tax=Kyrpidia tusciae (strain DSM 2912 / NBRC 15312 / T2) TaxID=562970 RepID=D5WTX8_KYRT2|nr:YafY family protein [Kyrpidia tusciae]ADG05298.1 Helix-turn-helix type 11 domain protein [Kyrpidia tusciae DSM 2912]